MIAAAINPLLQSQLDEARVQELIDAKMAEIASYVEAKLAQNIVDLRGEAARWRHDQRGPDPSAVQRTARLG